MSKGPEKRLVNNALAYLRSRPDEFWFKVHGGPYQEAGLPDLIGSTTGPCPHCGELIAGLFAGCEAKRPDGKGRLSAKQFQILKRIERSGGIIAVFKEVNFLRMVLDEGLGFSLVEEDEIGGKPR